MVAAYKPIWKKPDEELEIKVDAKVKSEIEKIKAELEAKADERIKAILTEKEERTKKEKADKIQEAINTAKSIKEDKDKDKDKDNVATVEKGKENVHDIGKGIDCPTCHAGHVHKVETDKSGLVYRCHGDKCGFEAVLVPKTADFKCNGCGMAIKKPEKPEDLDGCPFCGSRKAVRHDWSKLWGLGVKGK